MKQGSEEWFAARRGIATASKFATVLTPARGGKGWGMTAIRYALDLATERVLDPEDLSDGFSNDATSWGKLHERYAIEEYERRSFRNVQEVGFVKKEGMPCGGSPDGLVGTDGIIEVKCPYEPAIHLATVVDGVMPPHHMPQVQGNLYVTGRQWCHFVSFHPGFPEASRIIVVKVERDERFITQLALRLVEFEKLVKQFEHRARYGTAAN